MEEPQNAPSTSSTLKQHLLTLPPGPETQRPSRTPRPRVPDLATSRYINRSMDEYDIEDEIP